MRTRMYSGAKTWNPFKGCLFDCSYCKPTFKAQAKRPRCEECNDYVPHYHPKSIRHFPSSEIVFVAGNGDISFCERDFTEWMIEAIKRHNKRCPQKTYYFQSKRPEYFEPFLSLFPSNVILVTTLETNRDEGYHAISKAPPPIKRFEQFKSLDYARKGITIEPIMDFDTEPFLSWILALKPEFVYLGFNSRPKAVPLPEPSAEKFLEFRRLLQEADFEVRDKELRGLA
jgi:hypothetical protein